MGGARAFDGVLVFFDLFHPFFFGISKKGLDPSGPDSSVVRISKINTNIQHISKNQLFLFHLIPSYYILFLLFWG